MLKADAGSMESRLLLNQLAQRVVPLADGVNWFTAFPPDGQLNVLRDLVTMVMQARVRREDVAPAVSASGAKPTVTPAIMLLKRDFRGQLQRLLDLPTREYATAFAILVKLLGIADERRRQEDCDGGCGHWWHLDLSDPQVVGRILGDPSLW